VPAGIDRKKTRVNHLFRELAPLADEAWSQVDEDARTRLVTYLEGRRLVDFTGPEGWQHSSVNLGRTTPVSDVLDPKVEAASRVVLPLVEIRVPFTLSRAALDSAARGNGAIDLDGLDDAARTIATTENVAVFHGWAGGGIKGITEASAHAPITVESKDWMTYPRSVATGVERLALAGVSGPYGLALGSEAWVGVVESTEQGSTLLEHLSKILGGGPIVWAPGVKGGVVISQRGGDFELVSGQDISVGFRSADAEGVTLYLEESFTFKVLDPTAAVFLAPAGS
jgi:uncharacterized linocin/CFP29 family protein